MATDQQGLGTAYQFFWPCCGGTDTNFFQDIPAGLSGTGEYSGRTFGLLQTSNGLPTPDPQWPFAGSTNFAVNPVNSSDVVISSNDGRIFATSEQGVTWFDIGDPAVFGSPGSFSVALAYGAPDPNAPEGVGNLGNFIYVGTSDRSDLCHPGWWRQRHGQQLDQYLRRAGWFARRVDRHRPRPRQPRSLRGHHDGRVLHARLDPLGDQPHARPGSTSPATSYDLAYTIFGQSYNPTTDPQPDHVQSGDLRSPRSWRLAIHRFPIDPERPPRGYHPVLYVRCCNSGVYQSTDDGQTWTLFPDTTFGAVAEGGDLPHVSVTDLDCRWATSTPTRACRFWPVRTVRRTALRRPRLIPT